jgi:site-specific DNA-cytosine methylase
MLKNKKLTYVTLFSSGGVGCFGLKMEGFQCVATNEIVAKRMHVLNVGLKTDYFEHLSPTLRTCIRLATISFVATHWNPSIFRPKQPTPPELNSVTYVSFLFFNMYTFQK